MISSRKGKKEKEKYIRGTWDVKRPRPRPWILMDPDYPVPDGSNFYLFIYFFPNIWKWPLFHRSCIRTLFFSVFFFLKIIYSLPDLFFFCKFNLCSVCSSFLIPRITVSVFLLMAVLNGDHLFSGSSSSSSLTEIA